MSSAILDKKAVEHRQMLGDALVQVGKEFPNLFVFTPDIPGSTGAFKFKEAFPERFINSGISEQNTMGMASGLSADGWIPAVVGFAMFLVGKAWEPIRNSIAYPGRNVKIIATHAGLNVGEDGVTAQMIEDIALMRAIPGMTVLAPTDGNQILPVLRAAVRHVGPVYVRMERAAIPLVTSPDDPFEIGDSSSLREGSDAAILGVGGMAALAIEAAEQLSAEGIETRVVSMVSVKPIDEDAVLKAARETRALVVAEDHNMYGGLGGAVAEILAKHGLGPMEQVAMRDRFGQSGKPSELRSKYHMEAEDIAAAVHKALDDRRGKT